MSEGGKECSPSRRAFLSGMAGAASFMLLGLPGCSGGGDDPVARALPAAPKPMSPELVPLPMREPDLRVRIMRVRGSDSLGPMTVGGERQWLQVRHGSSETGPLVLRGPVQIARVGGRWRVRDASAFMPRLPSDGPLQFRLVADRAPPIAFNDTPLPGTIRLVPMSSDAKVSADDYDVVNETPLETYLPGVLAGELYHHWQPETFAAQAIAARSFACVEYDHNVDRRHYDVTNSQASQMYRGAVELARALDAVESTRGVCLGHHGSLIPGYYSSCCGGAAARATDAIGPNPINALAPLRGHAGCGACQEAPLYNWSVTRAIRDLSDRVRAYGKAQQHEALASLRTLREVRAIAQNEHGRPTRFALIDDRDAEAQLSAERLRFAANTSLDSGRPKNALHSSHVRVTIAHGEARIDGFGHGHGVGMCQYGAEALAKGGADHAAIIQRYYPGASLEKCYV